MNWERTFDLTEQQIKEIKQIISDEFCLDIRAIKENKNELGFCFVIEFNSEYCDHSIIDHASFNDIGKNINNLYNKYSIEYPRLDINFNKKVATITFYILEEIA